MKTAGIILAILLALALQTTIARFVVSGTVPLAVLLGSEALPAASSAWTV